jgi:hypothetical protein
MDTGRRCNRINPVSFDHNLKVTSSHLIIMMLPNQAIASARAPLERKEEGALLHYVCNYYAHPKLAQDTQQYS